MHIRKRKRSSFQKKKKKKKKSETVLGLVFLPDFLPIHRDPCWPAAPSQSHCSELFMVSPGTRSRLSGDIFIQRVRRRSSSSAAHLYVQDAFCPRDGVREEEREGGGEGGKRGRIGRGGLHLSCAPIGPLVSLCCGDVSPRRPCRAEWTEQPVGVPPKQLGTARRGTARTSPRGIEAGTDCGRRPPPLAHRRAHTSFF